MRPAWRQVALRAEKRAWSAEDIGDAQGIAASKDFKREVHPEILTALNRIIGTSRQYPIFAEQVAEQFAKLRAITARGGFVESLIDYVDIALRNGRIGDIALKEAMQNTFQEHTSDCSRQIEEHAKRETNPKAAEQIRKRLEEGLRSKQFQSVVASLLDYDGSIAVPHKASKNRGLDAGPALGE